MTDDNWQTWSKFVLTDLERLRAQIAELDTKFDSLKDDQISKLKIEIAMLKVKSGVWGSIGGLIPVVIFFAVEIFKG
jgi:hypothetical protein